MTRLSGWQSFSAPRVLLIAGGGTLGSYTSLQLLKAGADVTVIALEDYIPLNGNLRYIREKVDDDLLCRVLTKTHFDAVVDFLHYSNPDDYKKRLPILAENCDHLLFLSSYRVYADREHPLRENSPQLLDVYGNTGLLAHDGYGISKSFEERIIRESGYKNCTILRPLISFSHFRLDLVTLPTGLIILRAAEGKNLVLPAAARDKTAAVGWAGNAGKLIARLTLNPKTADEDYIIGNDENLTWEQIADIYSDVLGIKFAWIDSEEYLRLCTDGSNAAKIILYYDRLFDREVDNTKVREATGMRREDFTGFRDGLIYEISQLSADPNRVKSMTEKEPTREYSRRLDDWFERNDF